MNLKYKRVLLKLSGESLSGKIGHGIDFDTVVKICEPIKKIVDMGCEVAIVVAAATSGAAEAAAAWTVPCRPPWACWLRSSMRSAWRTASSRSALMCAYRQPSPCRRSQSRTSATVRVRHLEKGRVVVFGCGTGNPYFSTDTGAALRGAEIDAEVILKATMVDGVYDSDPKKNPNAKKYDHLTYMEILNQNLQVMDMTAASFCNDRGIPFLVFSIEDPENIVRAVCGENVGTVITKD